MSRPIATGRAGSAVAALVAAWAVACGAAPTASAPTGEDPRVEWLQRHAVPIRSIADGELSELEPLRDVIPKRKILVWGATTHFLRNPSSIEFYDGNSFAGYVTMGDVVWRALGEQIAVVWFTAHGGTMGFPDGTTLRLDDYPPRRDSLEDLLARAGFDAAVVDFRRLGPQGSWLRRRVVSRPLGYSDASAVWPDVMDALVFVRTMYPSAPIADDAR